MNDETLLALLSDAADSVKLALNELKDWGPAGTRPGQYRLDLAADEAAVGVLRRAGLAVLSEESGLSGGPARLLAVLDPVDGSTNAHLGLPIYSTSICVLDDDGPRVGLVVNQATGVRYEAVRGGGARRDGLAIEPSGCKELGEAVVGISGFPGRHPGWAQFRALGAASLELCAVAEGVLDGYLLVGGSTLFPWDYLAGALICEEVGAVLADLDGTELFVRDGSRRRLAAAATPELLDLLVASGA
ncbi:MAG TPA: inositol monophosphatase family protein [Acidimicrobiales bacterium]|nr:inositol monophosphatase family protein [Acidimicrobiales bacterium]